MKIKYIGESCKSAFGRLKAGNIYDLPDIAAIDLIKRGEAEVIAPKSNPDIGTEQKEFVEKAIKNIKKEGR